jgi:hypothetical protein
MTYEPKNLERWKRPPCYMGEEWYDYYSAGVGQSRDSDVLERANFKSMIDALDEAEVEYEVPHESHWAVGWVEWIAIPDTEVKGLKIADDLIGKLNDYPILDEELYSQMEDEECRETWKWMSEKDRLEYLIDHVNPPEEHPDDEACARAWKALRGDWGEAAQLLPSPSDLIRR